MGQVRLAALVAAVAAVSACATIPPGAGYIHNDGSPIVGDAQTAQFQTDRTICLGEMSKANLGGTVVSTDNPFIDAANDVQRERDAGNVMAGCMAQRGYKITLGTQT
jgi:starvation-inducible outer membrane lipoprotein